MLICLIKSGGFSRFNEIRSVFSFSKTSKRRRTKKSVPQTSLIIQHHTKNHTWYNCRESDYRYIMVSYSTDMFANCVCLKQSMLRSIYISYSCWRYHTHLPTIPLPHVRTQFHFSLYFYAKCSLGRSSAAPRSPPCAGATY